VLYLLFIALQPAPSVNYEKNEERYMLITYDGTITGLMTAIFEIYGQKLQPDGLYAGQSVMQPSLTGEIRFIETDPEKARRVIAGAGKFGAGVLAEICAVFASAKPDKDMIILNFLRVLFVKGRAALTMHADKACSDFNYTARRVFGEAHHYKGFLRFSETENGVWYAEMEPENDLLLIDDFREHFADRYNDMPFLIRDRRHKRMMVYDGEGYLADSPDDLDVRYSSRELLIRGVWREFISAIAIKERKSDKRQMNFLPLRHRKTMTEFYVDTKVELYGEDGNLPAKRAGKSVTNDE